MAQVKSVGYFLIEKNLVHKTRARSELKQKKT